MQLDTSWMSCRQVPTSRYSTTLLPFNVSLGVAEFPLESKPPSLPPRNSHMRLVTVMSVGLMCVIGMFAVVSSMAGPVARHSTSIAHGIRNAVGNAIEHANQQAELDSVAHYDARREYTKRRASRSRRAEEERGGDTPDTGMVAVDEPRPTKIKTSNILLRMAALRKNDVTDDQLVHKYFPGWITKEYRAKGQLNQEAVLRDVITAVSHLSHIATEERSDLQATASNSRL